MRAPLLPALVAVTLLFTGCAAAPPPCAAPTSIRLEDAGRPLLRDLTDGAEVREAAAIIDPDGAGWEAKPLVVAGEWPRVLLRCDGSTRALTLVASTLVDGGRTKTLSRAALLRLTELLYGTGPLTPTPLSADPK